MSKIKAGDKIKANFNGQISTVSKTANLGKHLILMDEKGHESGWILAEDCLLIHTKTSKAGDEYRVRLFIGDEYQAGADYFTDDREDAKGTAERMVADCKGPSDKNTPAARDEQAAYEYELEPVEETYRLERASSEAPGADPHISLGDRGIAEYVAMWKLTAVAKALRNVDLTYRVIRESDDIAIATLTVADGIQIV